MEILNKIYSGLVAAIDALVGLTTDDKEYIIGFVSLAVIVAIFITSIVLLSKFTKWTHWGRVLAAIGITIAFVFVFCCVCLIIDN